VQGATGVAGRLTVKIAGLLGAGRIVATGRDDDQLRELRELGADTVINTAAPDDDLLQAYKDGTGDGYDVIADHLWGRPTDVLLRALVPDTFALGKRTRLIQIGELAGAGVTLPAAALRTSGLEIVGAAKGLTAETVPLLFEQVLAWTRAGELTFDVVEVPLSDIGTAWPRTDLRGARLVVVPWLTGAPAQPQLPDQHGRRADQERGQPEEPAGQRTDAGAERDPLAVRAGGREHGVRGVAGRRRGRSRGGRVGGQHLGRRERTRGPARSRRRRRGQHGLQRRGHHQRRGQADDRGHRDQLGVPAGAVLGQPEERRDDRQQRGPRQRRQPVPLAVAGEGQRHDGGQRRAQQRGPVDVAVLPGRPHRTSGARPNGPGYGVRASSGQARASSYSKMPYPGTAFLRTPSMSSSSPTPGVSGRVM
jgi:hypothetical protein